MSSQQLGSFMHVDTILSSQKIIPLTAGTDVEPHNKCASLIIPEIQNWPNVLLFYNTLNPNHWTGIQKKLLTDSFLSLEEQQ